MANIKSQKKRLRQDLRRTSSNRSAKSSLKTAIRRFQEALTEGPEAAREALTLATRSLDKAAAKGAIHKNNAANRKGSLQRLLQRIS